MDYYEIIESWNNGNISDTKQAVKSMTKAQLVEFIMTDGGAWIVSYDSEVLQ